MKAYDSFQTSLYVFLFICAAVMILLGCRFGWKYMVQKKRCTEKAEGIVVGYTKRTRGGEGSRLRLPIVEYTVEQKQYRIVGPEYRAYITKTSRRRAKKGAKQDFTTDVYRQTFRESIETSGFLDVVSNPMEELFPQGTQVPVFYDPEKPRLAYVLRYCNCRYMFWMPLLTGILLIVADILCIIF